MLEGINNSGQKRLQIYAPWNGQSCTGSSISIQGTKIGDLLGGVKLPTKEQIEASSKNVQKNKILTSQDYDELKLKLIKQLEIRSKNGLKLKEPDENIISLDSDLGKKISKAQQGLSGRIRIEDLCAISEALGIKSKTSSEEVISLVNDYVPVYKPVVGLDGKIMGPWPEYVLVGYRAKTPNEKKGVELY